MLYETNACTAIFRKFDKGYREHGQRLGSLIKVPTSISPVGLIPTTALG